MYHRTTMLALLSIGLAGCSQAAPDQSAQQPAPRPAPSASSIPTTGFQRMIYDTKGYLVLRDRETGCQWIGVERVTDRIGTIVPRTHLENGRIEQLCTERNDPMSRPIKVDGDHGLFQESPREPTRRGSEIYSFRDIETGCEWIVSDSWGEYGGVTVQPRTARQNGIVQQMCRP